MTYIPYLYKYVTLLNNIPGNSTEGTIVPITVTNWNSSFISPVDCSVNIMVNAGCYIKENSLNTTFFFKLYLDNNPNPVHTKTIYNPVNYCHFQISFSYIGWVAKGYHTIYIKIGDNSDIVVDGNDYCTQQITFLL